MNKRSFITVLISVVLALSFILATGCANKNEPSSAEITTTEIAETTEPEAENTTAFELTTAVPEESTTEITEEETTDVIPSTVEEIVAYFNESANKIKPNAKKVVKNFEKRIANEEKYIIPESLDGVAKSMSKTFMKDDTDPIYYETREDIRNEFIVPNQDYVSKLKAEYVKEATCKDNGNEYEIYLKLKDQKNPTAGVGVGAVCDVIEGFEVSEKSSIVKKFTTEYYNCEIKATVDKETGNIIHIVYKTPVLLEMTVDMFGTHDVAVGFTFVKDYSVTY